MLRFGVLNFLLVTGFSLTTLNVPAQVARIEPEKPQAGQKLTVIYDPKAEGAKFTINDEVYVIARLAPHGRRIIAKASRSGAFFKHEMTIDPGTVHVGFSFMTMSDSDPGAGSTAIVYRPDGQPLRGACQKMIESGQFQVWCDKDIALYPDKYASYADK